MQSIYSPCPCNSGKKFRFCCHSLLKNNDASSLPLIVPACPVYLCLLGKNWQTVGMTNVLVARSMPNGNYLIGIYLIDTWCLGIKKTILKVNIDLDDLKELQRSMAIAEKATSVPYQDARSLVLGSLAYATNLGLPPHPDWATTQHIIQASTPFENKFEFGKNGEPVFIGRLDDKELEYLGDKHLLETFLPKEKIKATPS